MKLTRMGALLHITAILALGPCALAMAADLRPSWTCLPEETVALVRIPDGNAFAKALKSRTKLGALVFDLERLDRLGELLNEKGHERWEEITRELGKYNLKLSDLVLLLEGEAGFALVLMPHEGQFPHPLGLGWLEPGGDLTAQLEAAVDKVLEEKKRDNLHRTDFELSGHKIIHLATDTFHPAKAGSGNLEPVTEVRRIQQHFLLTHAGKRLLLANTFGPLGNVSHQRLQDDAQDEGYNIDQALEELKGVFARFLAAHAEEAAGGGLSLLETPGLAAALPNGVTAIELLGDLRPLVSLARTAAESNPQLERIVKSLGLEHLGPLGYRIVLDENLLRTGFFLSAPEPRSGIVTLLDQRPLAAQPAGWVPAEVLGYTHFRFDLAQAFEHIKKLLLEQMGDQVQPVLNLVESQLKATLQTDLADLLGSIGSQHVVLSFPPGEVGDDSDPDDAAAASARSAFVWQVKDEALWKRVLQLAATASGQQLVEEQGFSGLRFESGNINNVVGVFVGHEHLVVALGSGLSENVMAALRNPPSDKAALLSSPLVQRANELLPPGESLAFHVTDLNRYIKTTRRMIGRFLESAEKAHEDDDSQSIEVLRALRTVQRLLPSEDELDGVFGVEVGQIVVGRDGIAGSSVIELPIPDR